MAAELVIRGGTVYDGTGAEGRRADVAISDGVIREIGPKLRGARELDASGCAVAPGFIDIHTHYDAQVFWDPALRPSSSHGVTTVVAGNCGFTIAPTRPEHHDVIVHTLENVEDMGCSCCLAGARDRRPAARAGATRTTCREFRRAGRRNFAEGNCPGGWPHGSAASR